MNWTEAGQMLGAAIAAFAASWAAMGPRIRGQLKEPQDSLAVVRQQLTDVQKEIVDAKDRFNRIEERLAHNVNDEEFQAYVATTNKAVVGLTDKVGRAAGAIEAWYHRQPKQ